MDGAREDNPGDGRWLSQDPLGLKEDSNPYRYTVNNPANMLDPSGLGAVVSDGKPFFTNPPPLNYKTGRILVVWTDGWTYGKDGFPQGTNITVTNENELAHELGKYPAGTFDVIIIAGHGFGCGVTLGSGGGINQNMGSVLSETISNRLKKDGILLITTCNAGSDVGKMKKLATKINHTVIANTDEVLEHSELENRGQWREVSVDKDGKARSKTHPLPQTGKGLPNDAELEKGLQAHPAL